MTGRHGPGQTLDLFPDGGGVPPDPPPPDPLACGVFLLRAHATALATVLLAELEQVQGLAAFRHMTTPGGFQMSVAMTNCGALGWVSDACGYRYTAFDGASGRPWPPMPATFRSLATGAATLAGFGGFEPDACLINRYVPGARLTAHQDRNERDYVHPIVSVSLGLPAVFLLGGLSRAGRCLRVPLMHGDVLVWGGPARLRYHGVAPLADGVHPLTGRCRINLTFRRAG